MESTPENAAKPTGGAPLSQAPNGSAGNGEHKIAMPAGPRGAAPAKGQPSFLSFGRQDSRKSKKQAAAVNLKEFPPMVQGILAEFDADGDGTLDVSELATAANLYKQSKDAQRRMLYMTGGMLFVLVLFCGVLSGVIYAVVTLTRQMDVGNSGVMTVRGTENPIVVSSVQNLSPTSLNSEMDNEEFYKLKYLHITGAQQTDLYIQVHGVARIMDSSSTYGSVIKFLTPAGMVQLDGDVVTYEATDPIHNLFAEGGFQVTDYDAPTGARRKLLQSGVSGFSSGFGSSGGSTQSGTGSGGSTKP